LKDENLRGYTGVAKRAKKTDAIFAMISREGAGGFYELVLPDGRGRADLER
jgi:hypothetical protein